MLREIPLQSAACKFFDIAASCEEATVVVSRFEGYKQRIAKGRTRTVFARFPVGSTEAIAFSQHHDVFIMGLM